VRAFTVVAWCVMCVCFAGVDIAWAQRQPPRVTVPAPRQPRIDLSVLGTVATGGELDASDAALVDNTTPGGGPATLFTTRTRLSSAPLGEVRVGVRLMQGWVVEGGVSYGRPSLEVRLSNDREAAPDVTATTRLTQLVADGALVHRWYRRRVSPFVMGGAGYLRQLDEPRTTVEAGQVYFGGGGVLVGIGRASAGGAYTLQARGDVRLVGYRGGLPLVDERPMGVVVGLGLTLKIR
jgi:hypothetical protein